MDVIGVDPGFTETGLCYIDKDDRPVVWEVMSLRSGDDVSRAIILSQRIVDWIKKTVEEQHITHLRVGIEMPLVAVKKINGRVVGMNAATYRKQCRLLQEIQAGLLTQLSGLVELEVYEFINSVSKKILTGDGKANKEKMLKHGPFTEMKPKSKAYTLSDAYAHALATRKGGDVVNYTRLFHRDIAPLVEEMNEPA